MDNKNESSHVVFSHGEVVVLEENSALVDRTRRPATGELRKRLLERRAKEAEWRKLVKKKKAKGDTEPG